MTKILIADSNNLEISDIENSEENPSYTYETLKKLNHPKEELFFILGQMLQSILKLGKIMNYYQA